jgi:hypothetical protein
MTRAACCIGDRVASASLSLDRDRRASFAWLEFASFTESLILMKAANFLGPFRTGFDFDDPEFPDGVI